MNNYEKIIQQTKNTKHRFILELLYKLRLTTGMIINIKVKDIRKNILYCRGKRIFIPDSLMHDFYNFTHKKDPDDYLLKSNLNKQYSIRSIQEIRKKFLKKIRKL